MARRPLDRSPPPYHPTPLSSPPPTPTTLHVHPPALPLTTKPPRHQANRHQPPVISHAHVATRHQSRTYPRALVRILGGEVKEHEEGAARVRCVRRALDVDGASEEGLEHGGSGGGGGTELCKWRHQQ